MYINRDAVLHQFTKMIQSGFSHGHEKASISCGRGFVDGGLRSYPYCMCRAYAEMALTLVSILRRGLWIYRLFAQSLLFQHAGCLHIAQLNANT